MPKNYIVHKFSKELLFQILDDDADGVEIISNEIVDTSRWSIHHWLVFKFDEKFYGVGYSVGATEYQEESPWEYDGDEIEVNELEAVEKTIITYQFKKES